MKTVDLATVPPESRWPNAERLARPILIGFILSYQRPVTHRVDELIPVFPFEKLFSLPWQSDGARRVTRSPLPL